MKKVMLILNWFAVFCLFLSYLAPYINPNSFWPIAFFGLFYPAFLIINILFFLFWLIKRNKYLWISLFSIVIGYTFLFRFVQWNGAEKSEDVDDGLQIKVVSYNVRLFDLYNWTGNQNEITRLKIIDSIRNENAGILCLQEFFNSESDNPPTLDSLINGMDAKFAHVEYTISIDENHWGIATFSKYPIVNRGIVKFDLKSNNVCIFSDIDTGKDTIRVYNAHLGSILFNYEDYELIKSLVRKTGGIKMVNRDSSGPLSPSLQRKGIGEKEVAVFPVLKNVTVRLKKAFEIRSSQADEIANHILNCPYPIVLCGDFNDTPISYSYSKILKNNLNDAFIVSGNGLGRSYIGAFPSLRIDYVLHSKSIGSKGFKTLNYNALSDHYPLTCEIIL